MEAKQAIYKVAKNNIYFSFPKGILKKIRGSKKSISWAIINGNLQIFCNKNRTNTKTSIPVLILDKGAFKPHE